ncbi:18816_t:CDS:2, partial [Gigaspora rosea]
KISEREHKRGRRRGRGQGCRNKREKSNTVLKREVKTLAQLLAPPDFNYLKHNILFYQNFTRLLPAFSDKNITQYTLDELKIWLEIVIYVGVIKLPRVTDYWSVDPKYPKHNITQMISMLYFQQIKRYLYISDNSEK